MALETTCGLLMETIRNSVDKQLLAQELFRNAKNMLPEMQRIFKNITCPGGGLAHYVYRFYHHSYKMYRVQEATSEMLSLFVRIDPKKVRAFAPEFDTIVNNGLDIEKAEWHNQCWNQIGNAMFLAFFHCKSVLEMLMWSVQQCTEAQNKWLSEPWAGCLSVFCLR